MRQLVRLFSAAALVCVVAAMAYAFTGAAQFDPNAACVGNAKLLVQAIAQYEQDYDEYLPPTGSGAAFRAALTPYVSSATVFVDPVSNQYYVPNPAISGQILTAIANPHQTVLFQDPVAHADGQKTVAYVDGAVLHGGLADGDVNQECVNRARQVALGVIQYAQDYDEKMPPMQTPGAFEAAVNPYVRNPQDFVCPATNEPFIPNAALSHVFVGTIADPARTVVFSDPAAHADGISTVAYLDGHVVHGAYQPEPAAAQLKPCLANERIIGLAVERYLQDYDERFPVFQNAAQLQHALAPYLGSSNTLICPENHLSYVVNTALSGVSLADINDPASTPVLSDASPHADGTVNTVYVDGHVKKQSFLAPAAIAVLPDNESRLLWTRADGTAQLWTLSSQGAFESQFALPTDPSPIVSMATDLQSRTLLLHGSGNTAELQILSPSGTLTGTQINGPYAEWNPLAVTVGGNLQPRLLWGRTDGQGSDWSTTTTGVYMNNTRLGPVLGAQPIALAAAADNTQRALFARGDGHNQLWQLSVNGLPTKVTTIGAVLNGRLLNVAVGIDGTSRVLWAVGANQGVIWTIDGNGVRTSTVSLSFGSDWTPIGFGIGPDGNYRILCAGSTGALVDVVSPAGTVVSTNTFSRPS